MIQDHVCKRDVLRMIGFSGDRPPGHYYGYLDIIMRELGLIPAAISRRGNGFAHWWWRGDVERNLEQIGSKMIAMRGIGGMTSTPGDRYKRNR